MSLVDIANQLDALGLSHEADVIDRFLRRRAGILSYHEKPFLTELANVILRVRKYEPEDQVTEVITLPGSKQSLYGLTKRRILHLITEVLRRFIEGYAKPKLQTKYVGTDVAKRYHEFINLMEKTLASLEQTFYGPKDLQRRAKEMGKVIGRLRSALDRLLKVTDKPKVKEIHAEAQQQLDTLNLAIQNRDVPEIEKVKNWFISRFPASCVEQEETTNEKGGNQILIRKVVPQPIVDSVTQSYAVTTDPHKEKIRKVVEERLLDDENIFIYGGWNNFVKHYKRREAQYRLTDRRQTMVEHLVDSYERLWDIIVEIHKASEEGLGTLDPRTREDLREKMKDVLDAYEGKYTPPSLHDYQNVAKMYNVTKSEIESLALWVKQYLQFNQVGTFEPGMIDEFLSNIGVSARIQSRTVFADDPEAYEPQFQGQVDENEEMDYYRSKEKSPPTKEVSPKTEEPKVKKKLTEEDIMKLRKGLARKKTWEPGVYITLAQFLFHTFHIGKALAFLHKTNKSFEHNLNILQQRANQEFARQEDEYNKLNKIYSELNEVKKDTEEEVLWELWHDKYIKDTFDTVKAFFRPKEVEERQSKEAFGDVITSFKQLLSFKL